MTNSGSGNESTIYDHPRGKLTPPQFRPALAKFNDVARTSTLNLVVRFISIAGFTG